jgi:phenylpropionate dioxygenase-like ring-hydroxylating dioxygenase large terminal subunit
VRIEVFAIFPNTLILVEPDFQQVIVLRPQDPGVTQETFANYLATEASASGDLAKEREESARSSVEINDQDAALLTSLQRTRSMDVGGDTQLSQAWDLTVQRFQRMWARKLLTRT